MLKKLRRKIKSTINRKAQEKRRRAQEGKNQRYLNDNPSRLAYNEDDNAKTLLEGDMGCERIGDIEINENNVGSMVTCFQKKYEEIAGICSRDQNFDFYPNTPEKLLQITNMSFDGQTPNTLNNYTRYIASLQNALVGQLKDPTLYTQDAHKGRIEAAYKQCLGIPVPPVAKQVEKYPGFDCSVFHISKADYERVVTEPNSYELTPRWKMPLLNHVVLPNLNFDTRNIVSKLGIPDSWVTQVHGRSRSTAGVNENQYLYTHIQGTMKFNKPGHYYVRFISDDGVAFRMENQNSNGELVVQDYLQNSAWKKQGATKYYAHIHIKNNTRIANYARNVGYNYNIAWSNGWGAAILRVQYIYTGNDNSFDDINKLNRVPENQFKLLNNEETPTPEMVSYRLGSIHKAYHMMLALRQNPSQIPATGHYILRGAFEALYLYNTQNQLMSSTSENPATRITPTGARLNNNQFKVIPDMRLPTDDARDFGRRILSAGMNGKNFELYMTRDKIRTYMNNGVSVQFQPVDIGTVKMVWRYGGNGTPELANQYIQINSLSGNNPLIFILPFMNNMEIAGHSGRHSYTFKMFPVSTTQNTARTHNTGHIQHTNVPIN